MIAMGPSAWRATFAAICRSQLVCACLLSFHFACYTDMALAVHVSQGLKVLGANHAPAALHSSMSAFITGRCQRIPPQRVSNVGDAGGCLVSSYCTSSLVSFVFLPKVEQDARRFREMEWWTVPTTPGTHIVGPWVIDSINLCRDLRTETQYIGIWATRVCSRVLRLWDLQ